MDGTNLYGRFGYDITCPSSDPDSCANNFLFVAITEASGLRYYEDGIIGLWSGNKSGNFDEEMFMHKMYTDSTIDEKVFSFYLTGLSGSSYIDFGTPNTAVMSDPADIVYIDIESEDRWWTAQLQGLRWGSLMNDETEYSITSASALTDTGTSCIIGPADAVFSIRNQILNTVESVVTDAKWDYTFDCSEAPKMPNFELLYGGFWMTVTPDDYVIELSNDGLTCGLCFTGYTSMTYWILGDAFMRGWYNIHDHTNKRMGFVPFTGSAKTKPVKST